MFPVFPLRIKRVYEAPDPQDGWRVLVDRLWPRGVSRDRAALSEWAKDLAPSARLRKAYHGGELPFEAFGAAYRAELAALPPARDAARALIGRLRCQPVTLVYAAADPSRNHALILKAWLDGLMEEDPPPQDGERLTGAETRR